MLRLFCLQLAVALGPCVYIWDGGTGSVDLFVEYNDPLRICSVKWTGSGTHLAIGLSNNEIELYDAATKKQLRVMRGQPGRVNAMSWNEAILTSGGKRGLLMNSDVRQKKHAVAMVEAHSGDICGLSWSDSKNQLASGGKDNLLAVWDPRYFPLLRLSMYCLYPSQHLLVCHRPANSMK